MSMVKKLLFVTGEGAARAAGFRADRGYILFVR